MYHLILKRLLPPGHFWEIKKDSAFDRLLRALAGEIEKAALYATDLLSELEQFSKEIGNLSHAYIENALKKLGHTNFTIIDQTEDALSIDTTQEIKLGEIDVYLKENNQYFHAGSRVGTRVRDWTDFKLENDLRSLIPAQIRPNFKYQKEISNVTTR